MTVSKQIFLYAGIFAILCIFTVGGTYFYVKYTSSQSKVATANSRLDLSTLPVFTLDELKLYNGSDSAKPVYMVVNNKVYDVSGGRNFYDNNGPYHYLAGRDATDDLKPVGTEIITNKYPVIGTLRQT